MIPHLLVPSRQPVLAFRREIRPQAENTKPPRVLWVAFELGRLFGPPSDAAFQRRVILAALGLLERRDGPVRIEDFPEEDRRAQPDAGGLCPRFPRPGPALGDRLVAEIDALKGAHDRWLARRRLRLG